MARFRFIHAADIHLGYEQYNLPARADDFARAYLEMIRYAVDRRADFVLIAGDLFHRSSADAWMLKQATVGLTMLRDAGIPAIAVEGNHDAQHARKYLSWMEYLCHQELLVLLNVDIAGNGYKRMVPFDAAERSGSWVDVAGARIYGMKYYGAATARYLEEIRGDIEPGPGGYTILMLHAGMQGQVPNLHGGLTAGQLEPLRPAVDYVALGHVHKRLLEGWIFNPGSTEINSMEEIEWPHGFLEVEVDTPADTKHSVTEITTPGLRQFRRITVNADETETLEALLEKAEDKISRTRGVPAHAVIELQIGGVAGFNRQDLPIERLRGAVEQRFDPLVVRVRNMLVLPGLVPIRHGERMRRSELERTVVEQLVRNNAQRRDQADAWTKLILEVKNMAANKETAPATIADHVREIVRSPSFEVCDSPAESPDVPDQEPARAGPAQSAGRDDREQTSKDERPTHNEEPAANYGDLGGEPPCYAHLLEDGEIPDQDPAQPITPNA